MLWQRLNLLNNRWSLYLGIIAVVLALAACSSPASDPSTVQPVQQPTPQPTATPQPTPTPIAMPLTPTPFTIPPTPTPITFPTAFPTTAPVLSTADIVEATAPSVVHIGVTTTAGTARERALCLETAG